MTSGPITFMGLVCTLAMLAACAAPTTTTTTPAATPAATAPAAAGLPAIDTAAAQALLTPDQTLQPLAFAETGTTTISGKIVGYKSAAYAVPARKGQKLTVNFQTASTSASMNVRDVRDTAGPAVHRGETDGPTATILVPADTTYLIDPFLVRAVARRGSSADYTLTISRQ